MANEKVWNVFNQSWSALPRSVLGRAVIFSVEAIFIELRIVLSIDDLGLRRMLESLVDELS